MKMTPLLKAMLWAWSLLARLEQARPIKTARR
jgi:hypothetical protein